MPLISRSAFDHFEATAAGPAADDYGLTGRQPFTVLREVTRALQPVPLRFARAERPRGVTLTGLRLAPDSSVLLRRVSDPDTPLHVLSWSWDLSGDPPLVGPAAGADPARWTVPWDGAQRRLDPAAPLVLVPPRRVVGCQSVRVILWQSHRGADPGTVTEEVVAALRHSKLAATLATLASDAETTMMTAVGVREAAGELGREVAPVLRALCSDYVDFFEGFFPVTDGADRTERFTGYHSELTLHT
ncbi:hypothetical protein WDH52_07480 [Streptomyces sp. TRM70308]|uniref:hypothetical protein n=1 Tax=Streptomyces sp. TRM70308 TaxID=3131932 RepID=UPI003CFF479C